MPAFRKTETNVALCPFFVWIYKSVEGMGGEEIDVSSTRCGHPDNANDHEGNCQKELCPLMK